MTDDHSIPKYLRAFLTETTGHDPTVDEARVYLTGYVDGAAVASTLSVDDADRYASGQIPAWSECQAEGADPFYVLGFNVGRRFGAMERYGVLRARVGRHVNVKPPFRMDGTPIPDGFEGPATVVGTAGRDLLLVRGIHDPETLAPEDYEFACNLGRCEKTS